MIPSNTSTISYPSSFPRTGAPECEQVEDDDLTYHQFKSQSIPICKNLNRTPSELQLCADEQLADQRDYAFFSRLVNGISKSQTAGTNHYLQRENQVCLAHIIQTRHERQAFTGGQQQQPQPGNHWPTETNKPEDPWFFATEATEDNFVYSIEDAIALAKSSVEDDEAIFELDL